MTEIPTKKDSRRGTRRTDKPAKSVQVTRVTSASARPQRQPVARFSPTDAAPIVTEPTKQKGHKLQISAPSMEGVAEAASEHRVALIAVVAVLAVVFMLYTPLRHWYTAVRDGSTLSQQLAEQTSENEGLQTDIDRLQTREGIEDAARARGYVAEGEAVVDVVDAPETIQDEDEQKDEKTPWYFVVGDLVFGYGG